MTGRLDPGMVLALVLVVPAGIGNAEETDISGDAAATPVGDWPAYRRDGGLTGFSPLRGSLQVPPVKRWDYQLGGTSQNI